MDAWLYSFYREPTSSSCEIVLFLCQSQYGSPWCKSCETVFFFIQSQYGYLVVQMLLSQIDKHTKSDPRIKTSIVTVLYEAVLISAGNSTGYFFINQYNLLEFCIIFSSTKLRKRLI